MIYGANASGKSNLLIAIQSLWMMMISPEDRENDRIVFYKPFTAVLFLVYVASLIFVLFYIKTNKKFK